MGISFFDGKEIGNNFKIVSLWNDPSKYSFQNRLQEYLLLNGLGFDIKKHEGMVYFEVAVKDRKKKILDSVLFSHEDNLVTIEVKTGSNFLIIDMLKYLFVDRWADAKVESI